MKNFEKIKRKWKRQLKKKMDQTRAFVKKVLIGTLVIAVAVAVIFCILHIKSSTYDGLDEESEYEASPYNMEYLYSGMNGKIYDDGVYSSRKGIDVSIFQGDIDWKKVKQAGVDFAMIRLGFRSSSDGIIHMDANFKKNLRGAKAAGVDVGVYFFSQAINVEEAIEEAKFVLRHIRFHGIRYPVAFDMEPVDREGRIAGLSREEKTEIADAFCQVIRSNRFKPVIYGNPTWLRKNINLDYLTEYDLWLAHYTDATDFSNKFIMWQYTDSGKVDGIDGYVDLNLYFKK